MRDEVRDRGLGHPVRFQRGDREDGELVQRLELVQTCSLELEQALLLDGDGGVRRQAAHHLGLALADRPPLARVVDGDEAE